MLGKQGRAQREALISLPRLAGQAVAQRAHLDGVAQRSAWYFAQLSVVMRGHASSTKISDRCHLHYKV